METCQKFEVIKPDPEIVLLTKEVLAQNMKILEMNAMLLEVLANPMVKVS